MTEKIVSAEEFRKGIQKGIDDLANVVGDTMGPMGNTVIIKNAFSEITVTKDGVSVAEDIDFDPNSIENIGASMVKNVALKANNLAGDGTTTATVLAQALYTIGSKNIVLGSKPGEFVRGIKLASRDLLTHLHKIKRKVTTDSSELHSVALVSSNGDEEIAKCITDIYEELGIHAVISISQGSGINTVVNTIKGMQFDRGYLSPYSITDKVKGKIDFENPYIFLYDGKITEFRQVYQAVEFAGSKGRPLVIVAEDVKDSALRGLVINHAQANVRSAIVMSPGYGKKRVERLRDMAVLFGAQVFDSTSDLEEVNPEHLGECVRAEITDKDTAFIGGNGDNEMIEERADFIQSQIKHYKGNKYEIDILEERLGKLTSGVSEIKVGAISREEGKELLDRVNDCKYAVRAALAEGVVDGGGVALLFAAQKLQKKKFKAEVSKSTRAGYSALLDVVEAPFNKILTNAGLTPELVKDKIINSDTKGFNVKTETYVDSNMVDGIIDPYKVIRIALESAVSIVGTLLSSNYAIINKEDATTTTFR
jgi:chaperonin GroEL